MENYYTLIALAIAVVAGVIAYRRSVTVSAVVEKNTTLESELEKRDGRISELESETKRGRAGEIKIAELQTELKKEREGHEREIRTLKDAEQRLTKEFENISNKIFDDKSERFEKQNKEGLENILSPLKKDIKEFKDKFAETDRDFSGKFGELKNQVEQLSELNKTIGKEAQNLTKALKGDSKQQGNWGELVLEKTLEMSGLREGRDYETQESFSGRDSGRRIVDVIVRLPDGKDIVIDSKVSLAAYEDYCSSDNEVDKADFLKSHINSVDRHIKDLGEKNYQNLPGIRTLNFILMFIPVEPAYIFTVNEDRNIFQRALDKNVVLVCPSTLLAVLRTVRSLWQMEDQNANARTIAEEAGNLYDKFVGFVEKMEKIGKNLQTAQNSYDDAFKSLSAGTGNLIGRTEKMKKLGAKASKSLPPGLVEMSEDVSDGEAKQEEIAKLP